MYKITGLLKPRPYPKVSVGQRQQFTDAISSLHSSMVMMPSVQWDERGHALGTLACGGEDESSAVGRAREIIERNAEKVAHIYVQDMDVVTTEVLQGPW